MLNSKGNFFLNFGENKLHNAEANCRLKIRVAPDLCFSNPAEAGFGIADPAGAGAGAECS